MWMALVIVVPTVSFFTTLYLPNIAHALQNPARWISGAIAPMPPVNKAPSLPPAALAAAATTTADDDTDDDVGELPSGSANLPNPNRPLTIETFEANDVPITAIIGGTAGSIRSSIRQGVEDFVRQSGATAGLNGTFFANASLEGTDNLLIGPSMCEGDDHLVISPFDHRPQLTGRPMVLMSAGRTLIIPYQVGLTDDEDTLRNYLPDLKDAFLGGVWLVHNGTASTREEIASYNVKDAEDPRRRAFFGVMPDGRPLLGATRYVAGSTDLARALQAMGVQEAVLLDSGFSTSLVFQQKILVTGHTAPGIPSRPVPQALVLFGQPDAGTVEVADAMIPSVAKGFAPDVMASRRHHRHHSKVSPADALPGTAPGDLPVPDSAPGSSVPAAPAPAPADSQPGPGSTT